MSPRDPLPPADPERPDRPDRPDGPDRPGRPADPRPDLRPAGLEPAPESLPPEVSAPEVAAASAAGEPESAIAAGVAPQSDPHAGPHGDVALPPQARAGRLFFGLLGAPLVWAAQLQAGYSLGTMACGDRLRIALHLVSLFSLLVAAAAAATAWRAWRALGADWPDDAGGPPGRARFMAATGTLTSAGFFLVILAQAFPSFVFPACR